MRLLLQSVRAGFLMLALVGPALAQTQTVSLAAGLEAQYRAALMRERRLADERTLQLILEADARMRAARAAFASATDSSAAAEAALQVARADYVRLVNEIPLRDAQARIAVEAFRAEVEGRLPEATPDLLAAYQAFADGDRARVWPVLEALLRTRATERLAAARAVAAAEVRQLARLRGIMNANGEASVADVRRLWQQVAELDSNDFAARLALAELWGRRVGGDVQRALAEAQSAFNIALTPFQRYTAALTLGDALERVGDRTRARTLYDDSLAIAREIVSRNPSDIAVQRFVLVSLSNIGGLQESSGDLRGAIANYEETLVIGERLLASAPADRTYRRDISISHGLLGDIRIRQGNVSAARESYGRALELQRALAAEAPNQVYDQERLTTALHDLGEAEMGQNRFAEARVLFDEAAAMERRLIAADPSAAQIERAYSLSLEKGGQASLRMGDFAGARQRYEESLRIRRGLAADSSNLRRQNDVAIALSGLGDIWFMQNNIAAAAPYYRESLDIRRRVASIDPGSADLQRALLVALDRIRRVPDSGVSWRDVVAHMEEMERRGMLRPSDRGFLALARAGAASEAPVSPPPE